ncbi:MAG: methyltransferase domain-containing protein [Candidatus Heimdallarchaeum endolithica]|uniref:Methyltransferase domain-containing protein n=1 Tax=Candidatus Heimdallarchaeum endolithica TaxID=2876572 RepID=A0A9Y1FPH4_9ARCH|nr:MAG: methyltransferase domain-containing protein [Candidatus Heimdallarchaeum endolithica]
MHFYDAKIEQSCYYCKNIKKYEKDYPIRKGVFTLDNYVFRCSLHSQYKCSKCGEYHHFNWMYFCPEEEKLFCGSCNPPSLYPVKFFDRTYAFKFKCQICGEDHFDLYYEEYRGTHPFEINKKEALETITGDIKLLQHWKPEKVREGKKISTEDVFSKNQSFEKLKKEMHIGSLSIYSEKEGIEINVSDTKKKWDQNAEIWISAYTAMSEDEGDINRQLVIDPVLMKLIGKVKNLSILDAGCGNGYLARKLARLGAKVTGVDFSKTFIDYCKRREEKEQLGCKFFTASLDDLTIFENESFDLVVSNIVFIDVKNYKQSFIEISRVLKQNGRFIWSNLHPCFGRINQFNMRLPFDNPRNEDNIIIFDRYFDSRAKLISWGKINPIWQFERTLTEYSKALKSAGFVITEIVEPRPEMEKIKKHPKLLAFDYDRAPTFIIFECQKIK